MNRKECDQVAPPSVTDRAGEGEEETTGEREGVGRKGEGEGECWRRRRELDKGEKVGCERRV